MNLSIKRESVLDNYPVIFNNEILDTVSNHKHLGIVTNEKTKLIKLYNWYSRICRELSDVFIKLKRLIDRQTSIDED